jgi:preprotein translocase subunit YajC
LALVPIILLFAVMYLLVIRPQQRRVRDHASFVSSLRYGDDVVTAGGIFGTITSLSDDTVSLEVAPGVSLKVLRSSVTRKIGDEAPEIESIDDESIDDESIDDTRSIDEPTEVTGNSDTSSVSPPPDDAGPEPH